MSILHTIKVLRPGTPVMIGPRIDAVITSVLIQDTNHVQYKCSWFDGRTHHAEWFEEGQVTPDWTRVDQMQIGFVTQREE